VSHYSVLVVDDEPDTAASLALVLCQSGYEAPTAGCLGQARQVVATGFRPDAVVLDVGLPDADGYAVARELCALLPRRPVFIILTGHHHLEERSRREGIDHHFLKPADPAALLELLDVLAGRKAPAANARDPWGPVPTGAGGRLVELGDWLAG
jgi:DNA-binding response OmpR family regulator